METLSIQEARQLYYGGFKDIALKFFSENQLLYDFTTVKRDSIEIPVRKDTPSLVAMEKLWAAFLEISKGREIHTNANRLYMYFPYLVHTDIDELEIQGALLSKRLYINGKLVRVYLCVKHMNYQSILDVTGNIKIGLLSYNPFIFNEREQADHFIKEFWQEMVLVSLPFENIDFELKKKRL